MEIHDDLGTLSLQDAVSRVLEHLGLEMLYDARRLNAALLDYVDEYDTEARLLTQNLSDELMAPFVSVLDRGQLHQRTSWYVAAQHATHYLQYDRVLDKDTSRSAMNHFVTGILCYLDDTGVKFVDSDQEWEESTLDLKTREDKTVPDSDAQETHQTMEEGPEERVSTGKKKFLRGASVFFLIVFGIIIALMVVAIYSNINPSVRVTRLVVGDDSDRFPNATLTLENNTDSLQHVKVSFTFFYTTKDGIPIEREKHETTAISAHEVARIECAAKDQQYDRKGYKVHYAFTYS